MEINDDTGSTPLHIAALFYRVEIIKALLKQGVNKYARNNSGSAAFDIVAAPLDVDRDLYDNLRQSLGLLGLVLYFRFCCY